MMKYKQSSSEIAIDLRGEKIATWSDCDCRNKQFNNDKILTW